MIEEAIQGHLVDVRATKGEGTFKAYSRQLQWFRERTNKRFVSELDRSDAMLMFALGGEQHRDGKPLNQKTINKQVIIMFNAMRSRGATIAMNKGDWPRRFGDDSPQSCTGRKYRNSGQGQWNHLDQIVCVGL